MTNVERIISEILALPPVEKRLLLQELFASIGFKPSLEERGNIFDDVGASNTVNFAPYPRGRCPQCGK